MAYELIPGVRQDHKGRNYQLARYPNGKVIEVPVTVPELSKHTQWLLERVLVETRDGRRFESLRCLQLGREGQ